MQDINDSIKELGATLVAISPELTDITRKLVADNEIDFDILRDAGNEYSEQLGIRFRLPEDLQAIYAKFGLNLPECNGENSWTLPMPARIVADRDGIVRSIDAHPDYKMRPEPEDTLAILRSLVGTGVRPYN